YFFFQAEDGIRDFHVTGVQTCALPISAHRVVVVAVFHRGAAAARQRGQHEREGQGVAHDASPCWACAGVCTGGGPGRACRQAISTATPSSSAAMNQGAPGTAAGADGPMNQPKLPAKMAGPTMPATETRLISAPWIRPCTSGPTWRVISAWVAGAEIAHNALTGRPSRNSQPVSAKP